MDVLSRQRDGVLRARADGPRHGVSAPGRSAVEPDRREHRGVRRRDVGVPTACDDRARAGGRRLDAGELRIEKTRAAARPRHDVVVIGAGAAGLATAIFTRRLNPTRSVLLLDGAKRPGAKILISGGSRCNVTNVAIGAADFWGGRASIVRPTIRA